MHWLPAVIMNKYMISNFAVAIIVLSLFGLIRYFFSRNLLDLFDKFKQQNLSLRQIKEDLNTQTQATVIFNFFGYAMLALLIVVLIMQRNIKLPIQLYQFFFICFAFLPVVIILKRALLEVIAHIFKIKHLLRVYLFHMSLSRKLLGIVLAPILSLYFAIGHMPSARTVMFYMALLSLLFVFAYTVYKVMVSLLKNSTFRINLHFFLYLCAIEILPVLIFIKKLQS